MQILSRTLNLKPSSNYLNHQVSVSDTESVHTPKTRRHSASSPWVHYTDFFKNKSFLIPDTVAFAKILPYFKATPGFSSKYKITLVELVGYEAYFVEQWISSREPNSLIVTYTGDQQDRILAYHVQSMLTNVKADTAALTPIDEWPTPFVTYLVKQLESPFCVATDTNMGYAFITNLAQLNPFLSLIEAKTGNITVDYELFVVNHNLRELGCGSRSAATTDEPSKSMELKFKSTFRIDHRVNINYAVISLIHVAQLCLYFFGLLDPIYCDGLYCDKTEIAVNQWWTVVSKVPLYTQIIKNRPPNFSSCDSIQAIIGFTSLCRYLLELGGNNFGVPKDLIEVKKMSASIKRFQKHLKISETAIFDVETVTRLFDWAQNIKASQNITKDLSKMKSLVKNTVLDLTSGKNLQSIAQNANISPFHVASNFESSRFINCQNMDDFKHIPLGRQLSYLLYHTGKPIDLQKNTLAMETINEAAAVTGNSNLLNGVRKLTNQLNIPSTETKPQQVTVKINGHDENVILSDEETHMDNHETGEEDDVASIANSYKKEADINKKLKRKFRIKLTTPMLSSDEEGNVKSGGNESSDDGEDIIGITSYRPNGKKNRDVFKSSRSGSIRNGSTDDTEAGDGFVMEGNKLSIAPRKHRGSSLSSHFRMPRKHNNDHVEDDTLISDSEYYQSTKSSRRNTQVINNPKEVNNIKCVYASPHVISTGEFSDSFASAKGDAAIEQINDFDSEYDYEQGFEYDYEVDGEKDLKSKSNKLEPYNHTTNSGIPSAVDVSQKYQENGESIDEEYTKFKKRLKRRHSIPMMPCEMNKYAIQMLSKDKQERNSNPEHRFWSRTNVLSNWDQLGNSNGTNLANNNSPVESDTVGLRRNRSLYGSISINTMESQMPSYRPVIIFSSPMTRKPLRRSTSFSTLENSFTFDGENSDVYGFEVSNKQFLTAEVLAMYYLKLQARYQLDLVRRTGYALKTLQDRARSINENFDFEQPVTSPVSISYSATRGEEVKAIAKYHELEDKIKNTSKDNARLKYELRLLLQKTKEVENNLKTLQDFKIRTLNSKIESMMCGVKMSGYYASKFQQLIGDDTKEQVKQNVEGEVYLTDGCINWKNLSWRKVYSNPRILIYLFFHMLLCTVLRRVDPRKVEERWKQIDKNQTVTMVIKSLYAPQTPTKTDDDDDVK
ncbi:hypothetical protein CANINC_000712 [Pichia inconspicua]|uniref:STB6-like N-terminal domain-containing protein n=1 Tax=Pichia inconspicua TaxID=52247 RepID=A0A4T0X5P2_9ASCO|nr:hypothetical protein CANINC_000712 [[Candida] inconspicua]